MMEQNKNHSFNIFTVIGLSLIFALVIFIYSKYSGTELTSPEMFGLEENMQIENIQHSTDETTSKDVESVFEQLMKSYNEQDLELLENIDYRYANGKNLEIGRNYVLAIKKCHDFNLHKVSVDDITATSIKGNFIYSYKVVGELQENYVLNSYILKSNNGRLVITYMETKSTDTETIKEFLYQN